MHVALQTPLWHWVLREQLAPVAWAATQALPLHQNPGAHVTSPMVLFLGHAVKHAAPLQAYPPQEVFVPALHRPDPLQVRRLVCSPAVHEAGAQMVPPG